MFTKKLIALLCVGCHIWAVHPSINDHDMHSGFATRSRKNAKVNPAEGTSVYWRDNAQKTVNEIISRQINQNVARNVILFLGDGMSIPTIAAARVYLGGEEAQLAFDKFPHTALSKTYAVDSQVADSANSATAYLGGVKANIGTLGVGPEVMRYDCMGMTNTSNHVLSIAYYAQLKNKKTGIVTTAKITDASPAGVFSHTSNRDWESDTDVLGDDQDPTICLDVAAQLVHSETGKNLNVVLGGGRAKFLPKELLDDEGQPGDRSDGVNLIESWVVQRNSTQYVWNRDQLLAINEVDNVLGLFAPDHIDYNLDRNATLDPSLSEMTETAIEILSKGEDGYFLFVEGARIDMAHHGSSPRLALDETTEFSKAIQTAVDLTDESDTLIVVTADHAHTLSYSGYASRGNDIFGLAGIGNDNIVYATLNYANGPGYKQNNPDGSRYDISADDMSNPHYQHPSVAPLNSETHGGDDVAIYARGPWAHLFTGTLEQNVIPHLISYAFCVGEGSTACDSI